MHDIFVFFEIIFKTVNELNDLDLPWPTFLDHNAETR